MAVKKTVGRATVPKVGRPRGAKPVAPAHRRSDSSRGHRTETHSPRAVFGREEMEGELGSQLGTLALAGIALAAIEIELVPALLLGAAAMLAPKLIPGLDNRMRPFMKTVIRMGYSAAAKTQEIVAEAAERVQDLVAEAKAEANSRTRGGSARAMRKGSDLATPAETAHTTG
jgi:hypothetical protein